MTTHATLGRDARETAALYALGALPAQEADAYRMHLESCGVCRAEVETLLAPVSELSLLAPEAEPSPSLRQRVLEAARASNVATAAAGAHAAEARAVAMRGEDSLRGASPAVQAATRATAPLTVFPGGFDLAYASGAVWEPTTVEGVAMRRLYVDEKADRLTVLIKMEAGARYPSHRHGGPEECYVVAGDLTSGDVRMKAGDYKFAHAGSVDGTQSTENGCLLLIVSSLRDEIVPPSIPLR